MNAMIAKLDRQRHKIILMSILLDISNTPILKDSLVFKGGTALFLLHQLDRFSTDLDFDLIDHSHTEEEILLKIGDVLSKYGEIKDSRIKNYTIFAMLSYGDIDHNIKIEVNKRGVSGNYSLKNFMGIKLNVMNVDYITANKFIALTSRNKLANRDIYDIHFILKNHLEINQKHIAAISGKSFKEYIEYCIIFLEKLGKNYNILDGLGVTLSESQKQKIRNSLLSETIFLLHALI